MRQPPSDDDSSKEETKRPYDIYDSDDSSDYGLEDYDSEDYGDEDYDSEDYDPDGNIKEHAPATTAGGEGKVDGSKKNRNRNRGKGRRNGKGHHDI